MRIAQTMQVAIVEKPDYFSLAAKLAWEYGKREMKRRGSLTRGPRLDWEDSFAKDEPAGMHNIFCVSVKFKRKIKPTKLKLVVCS